MSNFFDRFLKSKQPAFAPAKEDQAVLVYFQNEDLEGSIPLQERLEECLDGRTNIGMFDGNEVGGGELVLYMYGPDAEILFKHIEPILRDDLFCKGAKVIVRWGGPDSPSREIVI